VARVSTALVLAALAGAACSPTPSAIEDEMDRIRASAIAAGASVVAAPAPARDQFSVATSWELESGVTWASYCASFEEALPPGYGSASARNGAVGFVKHLAGDTFYTEIALVANGPPLRVRVTFRGLAG
jgi:hypothetical protein